MTTKGKSWKVNKERHYESRPTVDAKKAERRTKVLGLYQAHKTISAISKELGLDRKTISDDLKALNVSESDIRLNVAVSRRAKWFQVMNYILSDVIPYFTSLGIKPSLRTAYYRLRGAGLVENTENGYDNLIHHTKEARLQETDRSGRRLYPVLPIDCFADETRRLIDNYSAYKPTEVQDPDEYIDDAINALMNAPGEYDGKGTKGGRWYDQPEYVEVWIEKFALAPTFEKFLEDKDVNIVVNKGYSSLSFLWENIQRLKEKIKVGGAKHVHVLYFGDFDLSGEDMVRSLKKYFGRFKLSPDIIKKVALTEEQIRKHRIPLEPAKTSDKRYGSFEAQHGKNSAELDAFLATKPKVFEKLIQDSVDKGYFDQKVYDEMVKKYKTSTPLEELKKIHTKMLEKIDSAFSGLWDSQVEEDLEKKYEEMKKEEEE
ncbi:MAG: hypothetical protein ACRD8Z_15765 [Nitrososphaeraceae archaeon]